MKSATELLREAAELKGMNTERRIEFCAEILDFAKELYDANGDFAKDFNHADAPSRAVEAFRDNSELEVPNRSILALLTHHLFGLGVEINGSKEGRLGNQNALALISTGLIANVLVLIGHPESLIKERAIKSVQTGLKRVVEMKTAEKNTKRR
ncbi:TPA: hypothetical protein DDW69_04920 [candidate division CPR2 bacterium]|uniref:Uncharacterized protein n=1 Tax=candidate division CPR2 bacterium GW2011_GWC1_41_48 TaxID=1618344 RepID=A0A0G0WBE2_UNCC2|nr:MAG: hypothetical protein UT47_C0002G0139 [candidate division CPR2 bacterium GW2011_GWC2_39_35]KKS09387.1 MAG: hypothetical protein UU65_C0002G0165 [candidate division CPR2 bacterium GW2011_GWC1_41_48]HBG82143.1 hypothetical protein [candidate division CPR2 bacterium]